MHNLKLNFYKGSHFNRLKISLQVLVKYLRSAIFHYDVEVFAYFLKIIPLEFYQICKRYIRELEEELLK
jgi:hypothetical protein